MLCKYIKLINNENIIAMVNPECGNWVGMDSIDTINPVLVVSAVHVSEGRSVMETFTMEQWIKFISVSAVCIPVRNIITMVDVEDKTKKHYDDFIEKLTTKTELQPDMPDNVTLEEYNELMNNASEDEDYDNYPTLESTRYYH